MKTFQAIVAAAGLFALFPAVQSFALQWNWEWTPDAAETAPQVTVCPFKYGKTWAYSVEIDDGAVTSLAAAQNLFPNYTWTDAPPGVGGGNTHSIVGGLSVFVKRVGGNSTYLTFDNLRALQKLGWSVLNHSYSHASPLEAAQVIEDHFWSQAVFALEVGNGRGLSHFVNPNGWDGYGGVLTGTACDYSYFTQFGIRSCSEVTYPVPVQPYGSGFNIRKCPRNNLDYLAVSNYLKSFPTPPKSGDYQIDFTHGISSDTASDNYLAWKARLDYIQATYGKSGLDNFWNAASSEVLDYVAATKSATASVIPGHLRLTIPDPAPWAALTLRLDNVPPGSEIPAPPGGLVCRSGSTVWITTPFLGLPGATLPPIRVKRVYQGSATTAPISLSGTVRIAAVQVHQNGTPAATFSIDLATPSGARNFVSGTLATNWGDMTLFAKTPNLEAPAATAVTLSSKTGLSDMAIWAIDDSYTGWTAWQSARFTASEISSGCADADADFDGDGIPNLMEYALGLDPRKSDPGGLPAAQLDESGYLKLVFSRDSRKPDLTYGVESCSDPTDPANWTILAQSAGGAPTVSNGAFQVSESGTGYLKTVSVLDNRPAGAMGRRFMRLKVSYTPAP